MNYELSMLFHNRGQSRQDECHVVELGRCEGSFLELMMILINFPEYEYRVQEGRIH